MQYLIELINFIQKQSIKRNNMILYMYIKCINGGAEMEQTIVVRGTPQTYICHQGAWADLEKELLQRDIKKVFVLKGKKSWSVAKNFFPAFERVEAVFSYYGGEASDELCDQFVPKIEQENYQAIISVGGGKNTDLAKAIAAKVKLPVIILPTLAATCAANSGLSVIYTQTGEMKRVDLFPNANTLVLIDPNVILDSPKEMMIAGIGDTLAKWYEGSAILDQIEEKNVELEVAYFAAKKCQENLFRYSDAALKSMEVKEISTAFTKVVETNILLAGMVGGFADEYGRCAGAHSIHDALTILPQSHKQLHGNKVAYGIIIQLAIENKWTEIKKLIPFYQKMELPLCLKDMGMILSKEEIEKIAAKASKPHETIHYLPQKITAPLVTSAINEVETYFN